MHLMSCQGSEATRELTMKRVWHTPAGIVAGLFVAALCAMPQAYTISARPGVINYIEGAASVNGSRVSNKTTGRSFLAANDTLSTETGKAEVLLTPGVFLRVGANSEIRMISPSLTKTVVEVTGGEAFVEAADLVKENDIEILDHGTTTRLLKPGLYKFIATGQPIAAVISGKAEVSVAGRKINLGKNHQTVLDAELKSEKYNSKEEGNTDDLYAWSQVRDQYEAASSFSAARTAMASGYSSGGWGTGYGGYGLGYGPGWAWNPAFNSWAWLPGDGAFFSPFGYGFFAPGVVAYAPVTYVPVGGGTKPVAVPVNPSKPPAMGTTAGNHGITNGMSSRPSRPPIYTTSGTAYRGGIGAAPSGHVSGRGVAASGSGGSSRSGGYGGGSRASGGYTGGGAAHTSGGMSSGGMSGGSAAHASGGGARR
jgi:hypothetical protein